MKSDLDEVLFQHLQRNGKTVMWTTPGEIAAGNVELARELGRRLGRHVGETRGRKVCIGERRFEYRRGQRVCVYRIANLSCVARKSRYV